jgi:hypothetical protein
MYEWWVGQRDAGRVFAINVGGRVAISRKRENPLG